MIRKKQQSISNNTTIKFIEISSGTFIHIDSIQKVNIYTIPFGGIEHIDIKTLKDEREYKIKDITKIRKIVDLLINNSIPLSNYDHLDLVKMKSSI